VFRYCPSCASQNITFEQGKVFRCPDCGFTYYHNTAAATACVISTKNGLLFIVRHKEPGKGMLDLPGGFVDPGEGVYEGLRRELIEELGFDPCPVQHMAERCALFASFPNNYPYKNIPYNTCDLFFSLEAGDLTEKDLQLEKTEIAGIRFIKAEDVQLDEIAFESTKKAITAYLQQSRS
jgi:ADP-ribose pyrophosphatase YjhB (NUDIX family)